MNTLFPRIANCCTRNVSNGCLAEERMSFKTQQHFLIDCYNFSLSLSFLAVQARHLVCYAPSALLNWSAF